MDRQIERDGYVLLLVCALYIALPIALVSMLLILV